MTRKISIASILALACIFGSAGAEETSLDSVIEKHLEALEKSETVLDAQKIGTDLGKLGPEATGAIPRLIALLEHRSSPGAAEALFCIGTPAVPALAKALLEGKKKTREEAARLLDRLGPLAASAADSLLTALDDKHEVVRVLSALALVSNKIDPEKAVPAITASLRMTPDPLWKEYLLRALGRYGPAASAALPQIYELTESKESSLRTEAICAAWRIDGKVEKVLPKAIDLLAHGGIAEKVLVSEAVCQMGGKAEEALPAFRSLLRDEGEANASRMIAVAGIWSISGDGKGFASLLDKWSSSESASTRQGVMDVMVRAGPAARHEISYVKKALADESPQVRRRALAAVAALRLDAGPSQALLSAALADAARDVRLETVRLLAAMGKDAAGALPALRKVAESDEFPVVRQQAGEAARSIEAAGREAPNAKH